MGEIDDLAAVLEERDSVVQQNIGWGFAGSELAEKEQLGQVMAAAGFVARSVLAEEQGAGAHHLWDRLGLNIANEVVVGDTAGTAVEGAASIAVQAEGTKAPELVVGPELVPGQASWLGLA